ncbi:MAG: histidine phosphatase family protein [Synechococcales bacterium]|nr:histidine phosphatase family protein [Synechococcales bacterium]
MNTRVILVRHGESTYNVQRRVQGHCDEASLTEAGRIGARQVGAALQGLKLDAIYSSPLRRAKATADLIVETLPQSAELPPITTTEALLEVNLALWEGMTFQAVEEKFPEAYRLWRDRPEDLCMEFPTPEGPVEFFPIRALYDQARQFWREVLPQHRDQTLLVVAHSGINRALIQTAMGLEPKDFSKFLISNCGISVLNLSGLLGDPVQLESLNLTEHLGEPLPKLRPKHKGPRILLVRHGETDWNRDKRFQGQIDVPMNDTGRQQAAACANFLKATPIDWAVSSPMLRPKETADIILKQHLGVDLTLDDNLREISHGLWEGKLEAEIEQSYPGMLQQWKQAPATVQMPEGENLQQVWERAIAAWTAILETAQERSLSSEQPETILVAAHDAVNKALLCYLAGLGPEAFWTFKQGNGAVTVIDYPQGPAARPILHAVNITSFFGTGVLDKTAAGAL